MAQRQVGAETNTQGWLPLPVMEYIAAYLDMPVIHVVEVATFCRYNLVLAGRFMAAGTADACCARGSDDLSAAARSGMKFGHVTDDGLWTLTEVEMHGQLLHAPDGPDQRRHYEDLTAQSLDKVLDGCGRKGAAQDRHPAQEPPHGRAGRRALSTLKAMVKENHDYRGIG